MSSRRPAQSSQTAAGPVVCASIAVSHPAAQRRRLVAVCIGQSGPELEALTRGHLYQQGAQPPGVLAGQVAYDQGLRVVMRLHLMRSSLRPDRYSELPLCGVSPSPPDRTVRCNRACKAASVASTLLWHGLHPVLLNGRDQRFQGAQAFVKHTAVGGQVKHHEAHLSPRGIVRLLLPGGGLGMGKAASAGPQLRRPWAWWASLR